MNSVRRLAVCTLLGTLSSPALAQAANDPPAADRPDFEALKASGAERSRYASKQPETSAGLAPQADLEGFRREVAPILSGACFRCHGPDRQRGGVRIDDMDPDLFAGEDVDWWLEVLAVVTNGEMPPADEANLSDEDRGKIIEWLSGEVQGASSARRAEHGHSSFRRMTRYEYDYALQDLLGLPAGYTADLLPDPVSEDGFQNSSESLHISAMQLQAYLEASRSALRSAIAVGDPPPTLHWGVHADQVAALEWKRQEEQLDKIRERHKDDPETLEKKLGDQLAKNEKRPGGAHYEELATGRFAAQSWHYSKGRFAWAPESSPPTLPKTGDTVAVVPRGRGLIIELGDQLPLEGVMRVTVEACRADLDHKGDPSLQLHFGWRASNDSRAVFRVSSEDHIVDAAPGSPQTYQWDVPMGPVYPRNSVRGTNKMGDLPSPSEYIKLVNGSLSGGPLHVHSVHVAGPVHEQWPSPSHTRILGTADEEISELDRARSALTGFLPQAWRRVPSEEEIQRKLELFERMRPEFTSFEGAMIEVLASVLASPNFLYISTAGPTEHSSDRDSASISGRLSDPELAARLAMFLWCSVPDSELASTARQNRLSEPAVLRAQIDRMLGDEKATRFSQQFVRQWLDLSLLDYLQIDGKLYPGFSAELKESMIEEPIAFFHETLRGDHSVLEFLHSDFSVLNERLAKHYGVDGVEGNHFRRVELDPEQGRGGLLVQAGLLAMNSDGKDSHPLKRGIWMLERLLNDPPPPPPPAVPEIDLTDPEIAKMTLKERIEQHRDHAACMSCHAKIDPWGIAFENFDAVGSWRDEVAGKPVDAVGVLFNGQELDGMDGLKAFLLENRQDQFVRALVHKLTTFALGRPLSFQDRAAIDGITGEVRRHGDGLATMVQLIATSDLFLSK